VIEALYGQPEQASSSYGSTWTRSLNRWAAESTNTPLAWWPMDSRNSSRSGGPPGARHARC
jgi:hypothetical protein